MRLSEIPPGLRVRVTTPLRPSGKVRIDQETVDARAEGEWFDAGEEVVVVRSDGFGLVVGRPGTIAVPTASSTAPSPDSRRTSRNERAEGQQTNEGPGTSKGERYLAGLIAIVALGTCLGAVFLLILAMTMSPRALLRALPFFLVGGAVVGFILYHLGLAMMAIWSKLRR